MTLSAEEQDENDRYSIALYGSRAAGSNSSSESSGGMGNTGIDFAAKGPE